MDTHAVGPDAFGRVVLARIALATLVEPGERLLHDFVATVGPVEAVAALTNGAIAPTLARGLRRQLSGDPMLWAEEILTRSARLGLRVIIPEHEEWPTRLIDLESPGPGDAGPSAAVCPPMCLWVAGPPNLATTLDRSVAVVGSRAATSYGVQVATELGHDLAEAGFAVVAGGGFGIEAAAHRGALSAGGMTVAALACGQDRPYPAAHASLFEQIGQQGLLISEYPPGAEPHLRRFRARHRLLAALTGGTVLVEAPVRCGARLALCTAATLRRQVMAVPGPVTSAMSVACHEEIRAGARLVTGARDVLEAFEGIDRQPGDDQPHAEAVAG